MEKFIKQAKEEGKGKEKKKINLPDNKKSLLIGVGTIVALGIMAYMLRGGTEVQVNTGVTPTDVKQTVTEVVRPIYEKQKQIEKEQKETRQTLEKLQVVLEKLNATLEKKEEEPEITIEGENVPSSTEKKIGIPNEIITGNSSVAVEEQTEKKLFNHIEVVEPEVKGKKELIQSSYVKKKKKKKPSVYIPAGSIVEGKLMYGFIAPEKGMYPPVVIEFTKPIRTANNYFIPAQRCLITTSAQYDISQGLALIGGLKSTLSCVLSNGKVIEVPVNIAVGEEIKGRTVQVGLTGKEKWLTGKDFATITSMVSLSGMANSYKQGLVKQNMTPQGNVMTVIENRGLYSVLGGVNAGVNKFVEFWMRKYDRKVPAIEVKPKKRIFVVFVNGADLGVEPKDFNL